MKNLLEVRHLSVSFNTSTKTIKAVRNCSFSLEENEILGVVGESGCGKSVLVKSLIKLFQTPSVNIESGTVMFEKNDLLQCSEKQLQKIRGLKIGMIFQDPMTSLNPTMKVGYQVIEALLKHKLYKNYSSAKEYVFKLFEDVGIPDPEMRFEQYPHELSGGLRQRILIAQALAPKPSLLIADEPTTALDVTIQVQILNLLKSLQKKYQFSVIFISHDLNIVKYICSRALVMYAGQIFESIETKRLFSDPKHPYTIKLLESMPGFCDDASRPLSPIDGKPPDLSLEFSGCSFCPRCPKAMKLCMIKKPKLYQVGENHSARCLLYHDEVRK